MSKYYTDEELKVKADFILRKLNEGVGDAELCVQVLCQMARMTREQVIAKLTALKDG